MMMNRITHVGLTSMMLFAYATSAYAQQSGPQAGPHGGTLRQSDGFQFETLVGVGGIELFVFDRAGQPVGVEQVRGAVSLSVEGNAKRYRYNLLPDGKGGLAAPVNLTAIAGRQVELGMQLVGLPGQRRGALTLNEVATVPATEQQLAAAAIARQKICPVSGKPLGSMGAPVAVDVNGQTVYACCAGCVGKIKSNPAKYAAGRPEITVSSATAADAQLIAKQATCPVMEEPLGSMGQPIKVMVGDKPIFLCCKGCIKKVQAEPAKYLTQVYGNQPEAKVTVTSATPADSALIARQKTCPVMEEPLGSMGQPIKVMVGDKPIFLCCRGCIKKVQAEPMKYVAMVYGGNSDKAIAAGGEQVRAGVFKVTAADAPYIAAQKICPVMDEPLDAMGGPYRVDADGKAIYICCPGCAKRIAADPQKYVAMLADRGVNAPTLR